MHLLQFLHEMMYCLSCFFCAQVYGFTVRICSLAISGQHLSIIRQVLRVDRSAQGKKLDIPLPFFPPLPPSCPVPLPSPFAPLPSLPLEVGLWKDEIHLGGLGLTVYVVLLVKFLVFSASGFKYTTNTRTPRSPCRWSVWVWTSNPRQGQKISWVNNNCTQMCSCCFCICTLC